MFKNSKSMERVADFFTPLNEWDGSIHYYSSQELAKIKDLNLGLFPSLIL